MNKKISFALVAIMLAFSMVTFVGCEDATKDDPAPQNLAMASDAPEGALYLYGGTPKVGEWQNWGANTIIDETYAADVSYNPCIKMTTGADNWGNAYPWAFDAGSLTGMTHFSFKIKTDDYDYILVKIPGSTFGADWVQIFLDGSTTNTTVTDVAGATGWKKVDINATAAWTSLDGATQCCIGYQGIPIVDGALVTPDITMYLADVYFY